MATFKSKQNHGCRSGQFIDEESLVTAKAKRNQIALFGGSFDPPHKAHLELLTEIQRKFSFSKIIVIPSHFPPGKSASASFEKRLDWTQKIFARPPFEVSSIEKSARQTVFAKEIFYRFNAENPEAKFYWILGEDQWKQLSYWMEIDQYAGRLEWVVMGRESPQGSTVPKQGLLSRRLSRSTCAYRLAPVKTRSEISSTRIRKCIEEKKLDTKELKWLPESIREDVVQVYRSGPKRSANQMNESNVRRNRIDRKKLKH